MLVLCASLPRRVPQLSRHEVVVKATLRVWAEYYARGFAGVNSSIPAVRPAYLLFKEADVDCRTRLLSEASRQALMPFDCCRTDFSTT